MVDGHGVDERPVVRGRVIRRKGDMVWGVPVLGSDLRYEGWKGEEFVDHWGDSPALSNSKRTILLRTRNKGVVSPCFPQTTTSRRF